MSGKSHSEQDLIGRMPRRRARGRSPHRPGEPVSRQRGSESGSNGSRERDSIDPLIAGSREAVRVMAEALDLALVAAAVAMREIVVRSDDGRRCSESGSQASPPR